MSSDSNASSEVDDKRRKSKKLHKHKKKNKKEKRSKVKKHEKALRLDKLKNNIKLVEPNTLKQGPVLLPIIDDDDDDDGCAFGPSLPPHMLAAQKNLKEEPQRVEATAVSTHIKHHAIGNVENSVASDDEDSDMIFGPALPQAQNLATNSKQLELEERALSLKLASLKNAQTEKPDEKQTREEWMLELPEVGLRGGLEALSTLNRKFYQGTNKPDFSDRSEWTKTPNDGADAGKAKPISSTKAIKNAATLQELKRDQEQQRLANEYKQKHPRDESLVEMHLKKRQKRRKEREEQGIIKERRAFSRDIDLKLNKIDSNQTRKIVNMAKVLDSKFTTGQTKFL